MDDTYNDLDALPNNPDIAEALGNVMIVWAYAEAALSFAFASIAGMPINMALAGFYRIPTFEARTNTLLAFSQEWTPDKPEKKDQAVKLIENLKRLSKTRNDWVHGIWCQANRTGEIVTFHLRAPESSGRRRKPIKAHDINDHVQHVRASAEKLRGIFPAVID
ncbi:hypothetical protein NPA31_015700 [Aurantimonas sp. MSK8Z-1]|uniref:hypothetical protein n=1 Tax=Mangrovibrevibacter kandeliae TaxID=2968473 RepID=UPI002118AEA3|nr:hypothetical protein [Aurantimonas sp. MSK8Z-1]MCW4116407.1 hypothetical protein [Aurantimonas sp. MSK8Z-1]